ncbi:hypothetical protein [Rhodanobacter sp. OR92]|uniref:hypothetical protein n=1 Tax=Rhodanobacter sp. OR92 TaxID=1076524 RepID=UPI0004891B2A|nr:hypothetical protein [Rhodanobacter sp. OR92]
MQATIERKHEQAESVAPPKLYVVWIDTNLGYTPSDWEMNSAAKTYELAEQEASECYAAGFPAVIMQEGTTPRPDGFFENPATS